MFKLLRHFFSTKKEFNFETYPPTEIEIHPSLLDVASPLMEKIEAALTNPYKEKIFRHHQAKNPDITSEELEWRLFELKKYFFLAIVFKHVPMFSRAIDELWHDMILFTREYALFCERLGVNIEHEPHLEPTFNPAQRAFFDFIYSTCFQVHEETKHFYGAFYSHSLSENVRKMIHYDQPDPFIKQFVRDTELSKQVATRLWKIARKQIQDSTSPSKANLTNPNSFSPLEHHAYWVPTWFILGNTLQDEQKRTDGGSSAHCYATHQPNSTDSTCSSCSSCGS